MEKCWAHKLLRKWRRSDLEKLISVSVMCNNFFSRSKICNFVLKCAHFRNVWVFYMYCFSMREYFFLPSSSTSIEFWCLNTALRRATIENPNRLKILLFFIYKQYMIHHPLILNKFHQKFYIKGTATIIWEPRN